MPRPLPPARNTGRRGPRKRASPARQTRRVKLPQQSANRFPQQGDPAAGPQQYPTIERRQPLPAANGLRQSTALTIAPIDPQLDPRVPAPGPADDGTASRGAGDPRTSRGHQPPQAPFGLSPQEAAALDRLLADWEKRNKEIHVLESDFYRWKYDTVFGNGQPPPAEKGVLKFVAPDKGLMKIEAKDPAQSEQWVCDGKSIFHFDYPGKVVTEYVMPPELQGKSIGDGPLPFVFGIEAEKLKQRYFMRIITPPDVQNQVWLEAYPRYQQQATEFSKVQVILQISDSVKSLLPFAIKIYSPNGKDRTVYQLQTPLINPRGFWPSIIGTDWWNLSFPSGGTKKTELPPPPIEAGLNPTMPPRR